MLSLNLQKAFELKKDYICPNCGAKETPCLSNVDLVDLEIGYGFFEHSEICDSCGFDYYIKIHTKERIVNLMSSKEKEESKE